MGIKISIGIGIGIGMWEIFQGEDAEKMPPPTNMQLYLYFKFWKKWGVPPKEGEIKIPQGERFVDWAVPSWLVNGPAKPEVIVIDA